MTGVRFIAGSGRSGTTWVQDALAAANGLRPVFEPLHPFVSEFGNRYAHRALGPEDEHADLASFLYDVCAGRRNRLWTQYRRQRRWLLPPPDEFWTLQNAGRVYRRWGKFLRELPRLALASRSGEPLIKCIRANQMLGWLSRRCNFKIVLIVRHPGAVIESELRGGWSAEFALDRFRRDARLSELTSDRYRALLERKLTPIEALTARWVIENQWVTECAAANGVTVVYYEHLRSAPSREWERIRRSLGLPMTPPATILARPSQQSSPMLSDAAAEATRRPRWLQVLTPAQVRQIQDVLDEVRVDFYAMNEPEPMTLAAPMAAQSSESIASQ